MNREFEQAETHTRVRASSSDWFPPFSSITYVSTITITARIVLVDDIIKEREKNDEDVQPAADRLLLSTLIFIVELIRLRFLLASK